MTKEPCDYCDGTLRPRNVNVMRQYKRRYFVIQKVPALVCNRCGMRYYDAEVVRSMEKILKKKNSSRRTIQVPVEKFEIVA